MPVGVRRFSMSQLASPAKDAREAFRKHHSIDEMTRDYQREIYKNGKLSVAQQIKANTGVFRNTKDGIENALKNMEPEERRMYQLGDAGLRQEREFSRTAHTKRDV